MTDVSNLDNLANAIASSSAKIKAYAKAQAAATQSQELAISDLLSRVAALENSGGVITRSGTQLRLDGKPYRFTGVNAYQLATWWAVNTGCGGQQSDAQLAALFSSLRPNSLVRFWAFQNFVMDRNTGARNWLPLDRIFAAAEDAGQRLLPVLANNWGACEGGTDKPDSWYSGGYTSPFGPSNPHRVSYWDYIQEIVPRYRSSPALGMWEPVNEPVPPFSLKPFYDAVAGKIKALDPSHLVETGINGADSSSVDVIGYHDYGDDNSPIPYEGTSIGLDVRIDEAAALDKALMIGEAGITAYSAGGCNTLAQRSALLSAKVDAAFDLGACGYLLWNWDPVHDGCNYNIAPTDPLLTLIHNHTLGL